MEETNYNTGVGVIVARFQVAELTVGHREILEYVLSKGHNTNVIFLGVAATRATKTNPLDFDSRRRMIEESYPGQFIILYQKDEPSDYNWSISLDQKITDIANGRDVVLYGSRDSFCKCYHGKYRVEEYHQKVYCSGTEQRLLAGKQVKSSKDWRFGCLYATQNRYPTVYPTVDCAIFDGVESDPYKFVYLARKEKEDKLRFVGGFTDPTDDSFEAAAIREAREETGLEVSCIGYIGSCKIDDWRYRNEEDKIITNFFAFNRVYGSASAKDDIFEIHRKELKNVDEDSMVKEHVPLLKMLKKWVENKNKDIK